MTERVVGTMMVNALNVPEATGQLAPAGDVDPLRGLANTIADARRYVEEQRPCDVRYDLIAPLSGQTPQEAHTMDEAAAKTLRNRLLTGHRAPTL